MIFGKDDITPTDIQTTIKIPEKNGISGNKDRPEITK